MNFAPTKNELENLLMLESKDLINYLYKTGAFNDKPEILNFIYGNRSGELNLYKIILSRRIEIFYLNEGKFAVIKKLKLTKKDISGKWDVMDIFHDCNYSVNLNKALFLASGDEEILKLDLSKLEDVLRNEFIPEDQKIIKAVKTPKLQIKRFEPGKDLNAEFIIGYYKYSDKKKFLNLVDYLDINDFKNLNTCFKGFDKTTNRTEAKIDRIIDEGERVSLLKI